MFRYGPTSNDEDAGSARARPGEPGLANLRSGAAIARRNAGLIAASGLACALLAFAAGKLVTPRYVATAQIYVDPSAAQGAETQPIAPGQDSNGFINYVESQVLIATSRSVLERVVKSENLERDPEFSPSASRSPLSLLTGGGAEEDSLAAAARAFAANVKVKRPERTFVIEISVASRDARRAAELANAVAHAYIDEVGAMRSDAAHRSGAAIEARLELLRARVLEAEKSVEDYKAANGLAGTRDSLLVEQQLKDMDDQIVAARARMSDALARADQVEIARRKGGDVGAIASQLNLSNLGPLRAQQAEARQKLADATAELGPRHPRVIDAAARLRAANSAVDAELARFAQSQRIDYARAKELEAALAKQLDGLKRQNNAEGQAMIGLRDLERKAAAARDIYELFVNRSRDTGEIQQVEPTRTRIISAAAAPTAPTFPPRPSLLAGFGLLAGLGLGFLAAIRRESGRAGARALARVEPAVASATLGEVASAAAPAPATALAEPAPAPAPTPSLAAEAPVAAATVEAVEAPPPPSSPAPAPSAAPPTRTPRLTVGASAPLRARTRRQSLDRLDLIDLGFPALPESADAGEFDAVLKALDFVAPRMREPAHFRARRRFVLVVVGFQRRRRAHRPRDQSGAGGDARRSAGRPHRCGGTQRQVDARRALRDAQTGSRRGSDPRDRERRPSRAAQGAGRRASTASPRGDAAKSSDRARRGGGPHRVRRSGRQRDRRRGRIRARQRDRRARRRGRGGEPGATRRSRFRAERAGDIRLARRADAEERLSRGSRPKTNESAASGWRPCRLITRTPGLDARVEGREDCSGCWLSLGLSRVPKISASTFLARPAVLWAESRSTQFNSFWDSP